jgi:hypothetical protein
MRRPATPGGSHCSRSRRAPGRRSTRWLSTERTMSGWMRAAVATGAGLLLVVGGACPSEAPPCDGITCPLGCCTPEGSCVPGTEHGRCGSGGQACMACDAASDCARGACRTLNGFDCSQCPGGQCVNGQCRSEIFEAGVGCSPASCPGCCAGDVCLGGNSTSNCGRGGAPCKTCMDGGCRVTTGSAGGYCEGEEPLSFGTPCSTADECELAPDGGGICKLTTSTGSADYPGGFCTRLCGQDAGSCGSLATCVGASAGGEEDSICAPKCDLLSDAGCRTPGYVCQDLGTRTGACWISP